MQLTTLFEQFVKERGHLDGVSETAVRIYHDAPKRY